MGLLRAWRTRMNDRRLRLATQQLEAEGVRGADPGMSPDEFRHLAQGPSAPGAGSYGRRRGSRTQSEWKGD